MPQSQQWKLCLRKAQAFPVCRNASISTSIISMTNPSILCVQKCFTFNENYFWTRSKHLQYVDMPQFQQELFSCNTQGSPVCRNAPISMEIISMASPSILSIQICPMFNGKYLWTRSKHSQYTERPQSQWKLLPWQTQASPVCRNGPLSRDIISEQHQSIYSVLKGPNLKSVSITSMQKCSNPNGNYFCNKSKHPQYVNMLQSHQKLFL